ncbi:Epimerase [Burkholderiales bacterium 8X]|nr:Epimerase [Burkholderiales bacterium 8X]
MKILVTGGAGFIGSNLCERLVQLQHQVTVADNLVLGRREHLAHLIDLAGAPLRFVEMDVCDAEPLDTLFGDGAFDAVFHLAANSDIARSHASPDTDFRNTLQTTWTVLEAMRRHRVGQIVFASTSAIYGELPGRIAEDDGPLLPISHYGAAKLASEGFISSYGENYGIRSWMARFPNVVGNRSTHGAIYDFVRKLGRTPDRLEVLGDGSQVKPYLHVSDLIDAILVAWSRMTGRTNVFNVGGDTRCTVRRMAEIVVEESSLDARIEYTGGDRGWVGDVPSVDYDTSRIRSLGWTPRLDSEAAVRAAARWAFDQQVAA